MKYIHFLFLIPVIVSLTACPEKTKSQVLCDSVYSSSLASNLIEESPVRNIFVYLPPGYEKTPNRRYPVLYLLHAYGSGPSSWLGEGGYEGFNITTALDSLISAEIIAPQIVVMPDAHTKFGGSWYTNSETGGNWIDFIAEDLVRQMDSNYRTIQDRKARGITGQSMGGYGALLIAMNRPDVFGAVLGMSSPNLVNPDPFGHVAHEFALRVDEENIDSAHILGRLFWSKAVAFSPNTESPPFYADLPVLKNNETIERNDEVWEKWLEYALVNQVENYVESLQQLHIRLDIGDKDPLINESRQLSEKLTEFNVEHQMVSFEGDHVNGVRKQFENSAFHFFDQYFSNSE